MTAGFPHEHVLFVVGVYPPMIGGVEMHVAQLAAALRDEGHRVTVVTIAGEPGDRNEDGIRVIRLRRRFDVKGVVAFPPLGTTRRIARLIWEAGATVVSTHTRLFPMSLVGARAARMAGVPHVHTEHGSDFVRGVPALIGLASRTVDATMGRTVLRRADRVLGVSEAVVAFVRRLAGVDAAVFYNAIDMSAWIERDVAVPDPRPIVFVGRLVPGKGWDDFTAAVSVLAAGPTPAFAAHILGGGPDLERCRTAVEAAGLADRVTVHGAVPQARVRELLRGGVLVNPTRLSEGFQTTLLEALAVGAEIVTYAVPGVDALDEDGAPLQVVPRDDTAALAAAVGRALRAPRPRFPIDRLERWSWSARAAEYAAVVASLRAARPQP